MCVHGVTESPQKKGMNEMLIVAWLVLAIVLCWICPWWIGALIWVANLFLPDQLPFVDEILSLPGPIVKFLKCAKAAKTVSKVLK